MADIEKMREVFEEVLKEYQNSESGSIDERGSLTEYATLQEDVDAFRARFNEAILANQGTTIINNLPSRLLLRSSPTPKNLQNQYEEPA